LDLSDNKIDFIDPKTFSKFANLRRLYLNENQLKSFKNIISADVRNTLVDLRLDDNQVSRIEDGIFKHLKGLQELSLSGNKLERIDANGFAGLDNLEILKMDKCTIDEAHLPWLKFK
jgi:Leucine-rich repeat (LRR) protein